MIFELLNNILNTRIKSIEYIGTEKFNSIIEYDFLLTKYNIVLDNDEQKRVYIRMIKGGKIKETIFCYWSFLYEENINNSNVKNKNIVPQKVIISDKSIEEYKKNITLKVDNKHGYETEITLVELNKFIKHNKNINLGKWKKHVFDDKDILFLGVVDDYD